MDVYPGLNMPVPVMVLSVLHQAAAGVAEETYRQAVMAFQQALVRRFERLGQTYARWLEQKLDEVADRAAADVLAVLPADATQRSAWAGAARGPIRAALREMAVDLGSGASLAPSGLVELAYERQVVGEEVVRKLTSDGRDYLASLGLEVSERGGVIEETLLVFRGALVYALLEQVAPEWRTLYAGASAAGGDQVRRRVFSTASLIYSAGAGLDGVLAGPSEPSAWQVGQVGQATVQAEELGQDFWEGALFFEKGAGPYDAFRAELRATCEQVHRQLGIEPLSLWQRKLGLGTGKEFTLRFRLPRDEAQLLTLVQSLRTSGQAGRENMVRRGKLVLGRRVLLTQFML